MFIWKIIQNKKIQFLLKQNQSTKHKYQMSLRPQKFDGQLERGDHRYGTRIPGSFYGRLFPNNSLHLIFSSYSLNWLSQAPKGLISDTGVSLNKENIFITETSHPSVRKVYLDQFESDFTTFLRSRRSELEAGGRMVLVFVVDDTIFHPCYFAPLGTAIKDMVSEGLIEESKLESFNMPIYKPRDEEIRLVIEREGSFDIHQLQITFKVDWVLSLESEDKALDLEKYGKGKQVARRVISAIEPLLVTHFGHVVMDDMFQRYSVKLTEYLETKEGFIETLVICLIKK
ncbi:hypothetical protein LWI28_023872 [Acer negundo]|uniref:Uncharacterized protein n=1 Tax=Acer negundo TaxID=4023 RepID=A0AAD5NUU4_ACENE|nr:hypothetical protein LWI28_023872 [Acer negundo]